MTHTHTARMTLTLRLLLPAAAALALGTPATAVQPQAGPAAQAGQGYHPVFLEKDGSANAESLNTLAASVQQEAGRTPSAIVVMVHGFGVTPEVGTHEYEKLSATLRRESEAVGLRPVLVGVHWSAEAGSVSSWMAKATGHRVASLLGFRKAVKNPYLEKGRLAQRTGRNGLRSVMFRLQDEFPNAPVHVLAHSMGAQMVTSALAPERGTKETTPVEQAGRTLRLGVVALAGADLDYDYFCRSGAHGALRRAQVWWVTVPDKNQADAVLELRRGAGRADAVGNRGLKLEKECLDQLLSRRGLVLDQGDVPASHHLNDYYNERRARALATSALYLQQPEAATAQQSILARLDGIVESKGTVAAGGVRTASACEQLYSTWSRQPGRSSYGPITVAGH